MLLGLLLYLEGTWSGNERLFDKLMFPGLQQVPEGKEHSVLSWNTRALSHRSSRKRNQQISILRSSMAKASIVLLQEVHGSLPEMERLFHEFLTLYWIFMSPGRDRSTGEL